MTITRFGKCSVASLAIFALVSLAFVEPASAARRGGVRYGGHQAGPDRHGGRGGPGGPSRRGPGSPGRHGPGGPGPGAHSHRHFHARHFHGFHVGFHEFAHLLDVEQAEFNGLPNGLSAERLVEWERVRDRELGLLRAGRSALDPYAADDPVEFFPVAVEAFLERPIAVESRHPALYGLLRDYLGQDPARWERERRAQNPA